MSMGRPRKQGNRDLAAGLYRDGSGTFYVKHPVTGRQASLKTRDPARARKLHGMLRAQWEGDVEQHRAEMMARKLRGAAVEGDATIADYAADWRQRRLPRLLKKNGEALAPGTRKGYDGLLRRDVETHEPFKQTRMTEADETILRRFLRRWMDSPSTYNYMLAALARMFADAVDEGLLPRSPIKGIDRRPVPRRKLYVTDQQYVAIIAQVEAGAGYDEDAAHEWVARAVDLIYLISHNPQDVLGIRDADIQAYDPVRQDATSGEALYGAITIRRGKTGQAVEIEANSDLWDAVAWFREWKRAQRLMSEYLVCYPRNATKRRLIGKRVSVGYISRRFTAAARAADCHGITLRDLRPKGLSDEYVIAGDSDKGGHQTEQMKKHYRRVELPMRARSNLRRLRG